jgi:hypothetical protein
MKDAQFQISSKLYPEDAFLDSAQNAKEHLTALLDYPDMRIPVQDYLSTLERELAELWAWALRRLLTAATSPSAPVTSSVPPPRKVISLLPQFGIAAHLMRRAIPFAALGIETVCCFHPQSDSREARIIEVLPQFLGIQHRLRATDLSPSDTLTQNDAPDSLVVVTGKKSTFEAVKTRCRAMVVGSTGRCAVLISTSRELLRRESASINMHVPPGSCTRVRHCLEIPSLGKLSSIVPSLQRIHPSVVLIASTDLSFMSQPIGGYSVIGVANGAPSTLRGLGKDPQCGWPGDYTL